MKTLIAILALLVIFQEGCYTQTTTAEVPDVTEGSGGEPPTCDPNYCENGHCELSGDGETSCICDDGYTGTQCNVPVCGGEVLNNTNDNIDIKPYCNGTESANYTVNATISDTPAGQYSVSEETCTTCDDVQTPIAKSECVIGEDGDVVLKTTWVNCGKKFEDRTPEEKVDLALTTTADPGKIDETIVDNSVETLQEVSGEDTVTTESADDVLAITNNLLLATDDKAQQTVSDNSEAILESMDSTAEKVVLTTEDGIEKYENSQSATALAVVGSTATRAFAEGTRYYYGPNGAWDSSYDLSASGLAIADSEPGNSYISSEVKNVSERISFKIYSQSDDAFIPIPTEFISVRQVIFSVSGGGDFKLNFETETNLGPSWTDFINKTEKDGVSTTFRAQCMRWNRNGNGSWEIETSCQNYKGNGTYASCQCTEPGEYAMRSNVVVSNLDDGLSGGEIAGIVIGSVVGVALIAGLIYYFAFYKKAQKNKTKVVPEDNISEEHEMREPSVDNDPRPDTP